ncbi:2-hydroxy-3-oxopropionate reductase [Amycolatopsis mediterranei S699]|uniref:2-hydroxy-3-oxopropionate reductase n=2 Tax=Amycolatopsis mediterranei TaxID=33910 RepID=A0A0H3D6U3_AMYMU|nr:2-hydroxy-3-oxopropionate reductase [Amycolatopsis mediterranei]ADJ46351.1 2-hydroxy-3-oxopropionate reductase [Amycolatopsis mediterranei U32]AEK43145.1 2-hydroxy-3-oxopropionate reductase [Amycolatopsis mediterranei S699]AFO78062.1 2-hydroxy-3-oxopropionate reductase [Amycolatopsis mediterranei S699]AGT85190.1 2-hydroxy-3-oxopropionate reductase [Amycolatopsis mediterranei RB]KDO06262.1 tartronate semialdehyde reductase [Amycolatopsis mediterranei]
MKLGFIGLGVMGAPMAAHLVAAGHDVSGYDVTPAAGEKLAAAGGRAATGVADAVAGADVVITMLPNHPHVEEVVLAAGGVLETAEPGALLIDMSTIRPETSIAIAEAARDKKIRVLDAPVSGGQAGAEQASLSIMVGGREEDFEAAKPVLEAVGKTVVHVGPHGAGQVVKAANQLVVGGIYGLVAEAIVLLEASGVDAATGLDVLAGGLAGSRILELKRQSMVDRRFAPGFRIDLHHKDMGIALAAARQADVALPLTGLVAQLVAAGRAMGYGSLDHSALLKVVEQLSGRVPAEV